MKRASQNEIQTDTMTMKEVIELTGLSRQSIYRRIKDNKLTPLPKPPAYEKRAVLLFHRADVLALLK